MGAYLSAPCTDKHSTDGEDDRLIYGASEMQGWRKNMEDAHVTELQLGRANSGNREAMFAVFDGHGGKEVSAFCAAHVSKCVGEYYRNKDQQQRYGAASSKRAGQELAWAFHRLDDMLRDSASDAELEHYRSQPNPSDRVTAVRSEDEGGRVGQGGDFGGVAGGGDEDGNGDGDGEKISQQEAMALFQQLIIQQRQAQQAQASAGVAAGGGGRGKGGGVAEALNHNQVGGRGRGMGGRGRGMGMLGMGMGQDQVCTLPDHPLRAGCTAVVVKLEDTDGGSGKQYGRLVVANAGDSRAVLCRAGGRCYPLSEDHKPNSTIERSRIEAAGGFIREANGHFRINGNLNLSRAIGDLKYKQDSTIPVQAQIITAEPDVKVVNLEEGDEFMVLACDGVWDILTNEQCVAFVRERIQRGMKLSKIAEEVMDHCLADDPKQTSGLGGDNMTCLVVRFK